MQSILIYVVTDKSKLEQPLTVRHSYVRDARGGAWLRVQVLDIDYRDAMSHAAPLPGESFCNAHPLV